MRHEKAEGEPEVKKRRDYQRQTPRIKEREREGGGRGLREMI